MRIRGGWGNKIAALLGLFTLVVAIFLLSFPGGAEKHAFSALAIKAEAAAPREGNSLSPSTQAGWRGTYAKLPLSFEENLGQSAREVRYLSHGSGYELFLTPQEAVVSLSEPIRLDPRHRFATILALRKARLARQERQLTAIRLRFDGANPQPRIQGLDQMPAKVNYFFGNEPKKWRTGIPTYGRVQYTEIYPGIDLVFYGNQRRLEYDFTVAPGADPGAIQFTVQGTRKLRINSNGDLLLSAGKGNIEFQKPVVYQVVGGKRREVAGRYEVVANHRVRFAVGNYNRSQPLILDPVLNYSTYLGGSSDDDSSAIAVDSNKNVIVAGTTFSPDFPSPAGVNGFQKEPVAANTGGANAAFVSELDPTGTTLKYSTYLAGSAPFEFAFGVDVDTTGKIYVTGTTLSTDYPTASVVTPFRASSGGNVNGTSFITKLDPTVDGASSLLYSSYLGGTNGTLATNEPLIIGDEGLGVAADQSQAGIVYVTGYTNSSPGALTDATTFPVVGGFQTTLGSPNGNAFLSKLDTTVSGTGSLLYSTYFGGNDVNFNGPPALVGDFGNSIVADSTSNAYVSGSTFSTNLTTTANAVQLTNPVGTSLGVNTAFVARVDTTQTGATSLAYLTYLGGTGPDFGDAIALGPNNVAYVTGKTKSLNFPTTTGAFSTTGNAAGPAYITVLDTRAPLPTPPATQVSPLYSTFLGGTGGDNGFGIRVDANGNAYVAGITASSDFPITPGPFQPALASGASQDGFVSELSPKGNGKADLVYSTFFGGSGSASGPDGIEGIALDSSNNVYITGQTFSTAASFPVFPATTTTSLPNRTTLNGTSDGFVANLTLIPTMTVSPTSLNFGTQPMGATSVPQTVTLTNNTSGAIPFANGDVSFTGSNPADFASPSNTCGASIAAGASCTVSVTFTPATTAGESATLVITVMITDGGVTNSQTFDVALSGSGTGSAGTPGVGLSPTSLVFAGQLLTTTSAAKTVTLTNTGTGALTINSIAASGDFAETSTGASACPISPATLAAGANCTISVTFAPTAVGARNGTLTITDNASGSPHTVPLSGTGWDFTITATTSVPVQSGKSATFNITMTPLGGFNQAVALACTGAPMKSSCSVAPTSVTASDGVTAQTATATFTAHSMTPLLPPTTPAPPLSWRQIVPVMLAIFLLMMLLTARRLRTRLGMVTVILILAALAGCSGSSNGTKTGSYSISITGTSGSVTKTAAVTITVN